MTNRQFEVMAKVRARCEASPDAWYRAADKAERVVLANLFRHAKRLDRRAWRRGRNPADDANEYRPGRGRELHGSAADMSPSELLTELYFLSIRGEEQRATETMLMVLERRLRTGAFSFVEETLRDVEVERLGAAVIAGLLSITVAAKARLMGRDAFLQRAEVTLREKLGELQATRLLEGWC